MSAERTWIFFDRLLVLHDVGNIWLHGKSSPSKVFTLYSFFSLRIHFFSKSSKLGLPVKILLAPSYLFLSSIRVPAKAGVQSELNRYWPFWDGYTYSKIKFLFQAHWFLEVSNLHAFLENTSAFGMILVSSIRTTLFFECWYFVDSVSLRQTW